MWVSGAAMLTQLQGWKTPQLPASPSSASGFRLKRRAVCPAAILTFWMLSASAFAQSNACDLAAPYGTIDVADVQAAINMLFGTCPSTINIAGAGVCNAVVVQRVVNAALGGPCSTPTTHGVTLTWVASTSAGVAKYYVFRSTTSGTSYAKVGEVPSTQLSYDDQAVVAGQTYFYVVTAVDGAGNQSAYSTEVKATIPAP